MDKGRRTIFIGLLVLVNGEHTRNDKEVEEVLSAFSYLYSSIVQVKPFVQGID